jgi:hypothetical protein
LSTNPLIDLPLVQVLQVARETRQSARSPSSAARNGRLNTDRSTVRGGLWTGQTSRPHTYPQACG